MLTYQDRKRATLRVEEALLKAVEANILTQDLADHIRSVLTIEWSNAMGRAMGKALYNRDGKAAFIRLSIPLWDVASEAAKRETLYHEMAHIIDFASIFSDSARTASFDREGSRRPHGPRWRKIMRAIGYPNPSRTHSVVNEDFEKSRGRVPIYCKCRLVGWMAGDAAAKYISGRHRCRKCLSTLEVRIP